MEKTEKKMTGARLDTELVQDLKILGIKLNRSLASLLDEAARDLLVKYASKNDKTPSV